MVRGARGQRRGHPAIGTQPGGRDRGSGAVSVSGRGDPVEAAVLGAGGACTCTGSAVRRERMPTAGRSVPYAAVPLSFPRRGPRGEAACSGG